MKLDNATSMKRTMLALVLTLAAVAAPCAAWFVTGWRDVQSRVAAEIEEPRQRAKEAAVRLADQLAIYLGNLRDKESKRNVFHYQNLYHDPRGAYAGSGIVPSPLASGPEDPLILAHFQIDTEGRVSLPTINDEVPERNTKNDISGQRMFLEKLTFNSSMCVAALVEPNEPYWTVVPGRMSRVVNPQQLALAQQQADDPNANDQQTQQFQQGAAPNAPGRTAATRTNQEKQAQKPPQRDQAPNSAPQINTTNRSNQKAPQSQQGGQQEKQQGAQQDEQRGGQQEKQQQEVQRVTQGRQSGQGQGQGSQGRDQAQGQAVGTVGRAGVQRLANNQSAQPQSRDQSAGQSNSARQQTDHAQAQYQSRRVPQRSFRYYQEQLKQQKPATSSSKNKVSPDEWNQNLLANTLYQGIKGNKPRVNSKVTSNAKPMAKGGPLNPSTNATAAMKGEVVIHVGALQWHSLPLIDDQPTLVALRQVHTPMGVWTQGFTIDKQKASQWLNNHKGAMFPARLVVGQQPDQSIAAPVHLGNASWHIAVDARNESNKANMRAGEIRQQFLFQFLLGTMAALLAGAFVVGLVRQSERLAGQRSQFAASAAHELRTPLAGLRMYGEMLAEGLGDPAKTSQYARRVADESERLGRVVSNVLGFSRLERGALAVRLSTGDLSAVVRDCVTKQRPAIEAVGASIEFSAPDDLPDVRFDHDAVFQIVSNLIDNAEKYTRDCENRCINVDISRQGGQALIRVADHGPGIAPPMRRRLFKPFARGTDPDAPAGLGLGLPLAEALTQSQGGQIKYDDAPDGGAVFCVYLSIA